MIMVKAVKWVDEVIPDAPYAITEEFMKRLFDEYRIDEILSFWVFLGSIDRRRSLYGFG